MTKTETTIRFTQDYEVQDEHAGTEKATRFKKGQRKAVAEATARHFLDRGVAEMVRGGKTSA